MCYSICANLSARPGDPPNAHTTDSERTFFIVSSVSRRALFRKGRAMTFNADIHRWDTLAEFTQHLQSIPRPAWVKRLVVHNTYIPNEQMWRGLASMNGMRATYIGKGWSAGPHLYLAAECLNPNDKGIWQMTPLSSPGVHAGPCNADALGIENVGDFDAHPPTPSQYALLLGVLLALCHSWALTAGDLLVHKECMPGRTCPGRYLPPDKLRVDLAARLAAQSGHGPYRVAGLPVYYDSLLTKPTGAHLQPGAVVLIDATAADNPARYAPRAVHVSDTQGGGFVNIDGLERP